MPLLIFMNTNVNKISFIIFILVYLQYTLDIKLLYNLAEFYIAILFFNSFRIQNTPRFYFVIFFLFIINSLLFIFFSKYYQFHSLVANARLWFIPMAMYYIGFFYSRENDYKSLTDFLITILIICLPLSVIAHIFYYREFALFDINKLGDPIGGIFGPLGGSGLLGQLLTVIIIYFVYQKIVLKIRIPKFNICLIIFVILIVSAQSKIVVYLLVVFGLVLLFFQFKIGKVSLNFLVRVIIVGGVFFVIVLFAMSFLFPNSNFILPYEKFISEEKTVYTRGMTQDALERYRLNRAEANSWVFNQLENSNTILMGFGPGSSNWSDRYQSVVNQKGYKYLHLEWITGPSIFFEYGLIGFFIWLMIVLYLIKFLFGSTVYLYKSNKMISGMGMFLTLFSIVMLISLFYNNAFFRINFGGMFFLYLGSYIHQTSGKRTVNNGTWPQLK